jgi:tetratricopeptide (TPR) repeat protein/DNA-binding XRE family transcriptional regulator
MKMDVAVSFGEVLKDLRIRKKVSRPKLAQQINMSASSIEKWERGDVLPDRARVEDLIRALKLSEAERGLLLEAHAGLRVLPSLHNLPSSRNPYFTGREEILQQLHQQLAPSRRLAISQAISGLGGVGKTQVALEYVYRHQRDYQHVLWARADSRESLISEFERLAADLDLPGNKDQDPNRVVAAVQNWLRQYLDWLLILDNIEDLGLVNSFVPPDHLGFVLLTTRMRVTERVAPALQLDCMTDEEGALLLLRRTKRLASDASLDTASADECLQAQIISRTLGGLPLALDQAGAYILETHCALADYLPLYEQRRADLLRRRGSVPSDHPESVTVTFSLAIERVQRKNRAAVELLRICAFLVPDAIPEDLITKGAEHLGSLLQTVAADPFAFNEAIEELLNYSLVYRDPGTHRLTIHRLVQAILKDGMDKGVQQQWIQRAVKAVNAALPEITYESWPNCQQLLPHALVCTELIVECDLVMPEAVRLLTEIGYYLSLRTQYTDALLLLQRALAINEQELGSAHPQTAYVLDCLAHSYIDQGRYSEAESLLQRVLAIHEQVYGLNHLETATDFNNLAFLYKKQGRYSEAEPLFQRALKIDEQILGPMDIETANVLNNLASLYDMQGRYSEAEPFIQRALVIREQELGPMHQRTACNLNDLAGIYKRQGRLSEAEPLMQRALAINEQMLGPVHPETADVLNNLAGLYGLQGRYSEAERLYERAQKIYEQALGPMHPSVAYNFNDLAEVYKRQGRLSEAEPLLRHALEIRELVLGPTHPDTVAVRENYTDLLEKMKQTQQL